MTDLVQDWAEDEDLKIFYGLEEVKRWGSWLGLETIVAFGDINKVNIEVLYDDGQRVKTSYLFAVLLYQSLRECD